MGLHHKYGVAHFLIGLENPLLIWNKTNPFPPGGCNHNHDQAGCYRGPNSWYNKFLLGDITTPLGYNIWHGFHDEDKTVETDKR